MIQVELSKEDWEVVCFALSFFADLDSDTLDENAIPDHWITRARDLWYGIEEKTGQVGDRTP